LGFSMSIRLLSDEESGIALLKTNENPQTFKITLEASLAVGISRTMLVIMTRLT
jgi:hypothetical protein